MPTETEVKIPFPAGPQNAHTLIVSKGFEILETRILESDQIFDLQGSPLKAADQLLRLRRSGPRATVTYKGPAQRSPHKSREEIEFDVTDPSHFELVLLRLGYSPRFRYEKYRTKFAAPSDAGGLVTIDETPIGVFLELEGSPDWIDRTAALLGFSPSDYSTASYHALYREYLCTHEGDPGNMVFRQTTNTGPLPETQTKNT
jgi:adenylate cyclase class 2